MRTKILIVVVVVALLAASFVAGMVTAIRIERKADAPQIQPQVPWNGCAGCEDRYPEWLCWLSGC